MEDFENRKFTLMFRLREQGGQIRMVGKKGILEESVGIVIQHSPSTIRRRMMMDMLSKGRSEHVWAFLDCNTDEDPTHKP